MFKTFLQDMIPINGVAQGLHKHVSTVHRWCGPGVRGKTLTSYLVGGRRYIKSSDLAEFLEANPPSDTCDSDDLRHRCAQDRLKAFGVRSHQDRSPRT